MRQFYHMSCYFVEVFLHSKKVMTQVFFEFKVKEKKPDITVWHNVTTNRKNRSLCFGLNIHGPQPNSHSMFPLKEILASPKHFGKAGLQMNHYSLQGDK